MRSSSKKTAMIVVASVLGSLTVLILIVILLGQLWISARDPNKSILNTMQRISKGAETEIRFRGRVVYEDGSPVTNAKVGILLESHRGADGTTGLNATPRSASLKTDINGEFLIEDSCRLLRIKSIDGPGEWLYDESGIRRKYILNNRNYGFAKYGGTSFYIPDETSPAVFVLVRPDHVIHAWPSRGGADGYTNGQRYVNTPLVPERPSMPLPQTNAGWVYQP